MGAAEIILSVAIPVLIGWGLALAAMSNASPMEFLFARACFVLAGFLGCGLTLFWLGNSTYPTAERIVIGAVVAGLTVVGTLTAVQWVGRREKRSSPSPTAPPTQADMTIWQAVNYLATKSQWSYEPRQQVEPHTLLDEAFRSCSIKAWGRRCLTPVDDLEAAVWKEPPAVQLNGYEEPIPCHHWAHMGIIAKWIGYAGFPHNEYPSAGSPHLTGRRGDRWVHCYGHLRVDSQEIQRLWPQRSAGMASNATHAGDSTYWTLAEAVTWMAFGRPITPSEYRDIAVAEFLSMHPPEEQDALNSAEELLFEKLRSQSMKALGKEGSSEKYSDIPHTVFLSKVGINILHNTIGMDWGADLVTRERWDLPDWRDVKVLRSDVLRFWPQPGTTPYEEFVPLSEAARIAFEETGAVDAVITTNTPEERLSYHANAIIDDDLRDSLLAIYGARPPGRKRQRVPKKELKYSLTSDLAGIGDGKGSTGWDNLCLRRTHLNAHIARWKKRADEIRAAKKERDNEPQGSS